MKPKICTVSTREGKMSYRDRKGRVNMWSDLFEQWSIHRFVKQKKEATAFNVFNRSKFDWQRARPINRLQFAKFSKRVLKGWKMAMLFDLLQAVNSRNKIRFDLIRIRLVKKTLRREVWVSVLAGKHWYKYADWRSKLMMKEVWC